MSKNVGHVIANEVKQSPMVKGDCFCFAAPEVRSACSVIANEVKQSPKTKGNGFASFAMTDDEFTIPVEGK